MGKGNKDLEGEAALAGCRCRREAKKAAKGVRVRTTLNAKERDHRLNDKACLVVSPRFSEEEGSEAGSPARRRARRDKAGRAEEL